jgi:acyl dehydratase
MAVNQEFEGRTLPPGEPYEVSRVKIQEFADAIGDPNPVFRDKDAAVAAGHPDVIAPPTFAIVLSIVGNSRVLSDPDFGLNYAMVVHGEERFEYARPIQAGDVLVATSKISRIRTVKSNTMVTTETAIATVAGEHVCTAHSILVERG